MNNRRFILLATLLIVVLPFVSGCYRREMPDEMKAEVERIKSLPRDPNVYGAWYHEKKHPKGSDSFTFYNPDGSFFIAHPFRNRNGEILYLKRFNDVDFYYSAMDGIFTIYWVTPASIRTVWQLRKIHQCKYTIEDGEMICYDMITGTGEEESRHKLVDVSSIPLK